MRIYYCLLSEHVRQAYNEEPEDDSLAAHRSLVDANILAISENNIIITTTSAKGELKGRLIDLDLRKKLYSVPSGASHQTETMHFMAIEVLQGKGQHELEYFSTSLYRCVFVMVMKLRAINQKQVD